MYFKKYELEEASSYLRDHNFINYRLILEFMIKVPKDLRVTGYPEIDLANYIKDKEENGIQITISYRNINGECRYIWEEERIYEG